MADYFATDFTDVEEGELEDEEAVQSSEQATHEIEHGSQNNEAANQRNLEEKTLADETSLKTGSSLPDQPLFGHDKEKLPAVPAKNVLTTEEEEYFRMQTVESRVIVTKPSDEDDYQFGQQVQPDLHRFGLPSSFRTAGRGERGMRRPFRSRGFINSFSNFRGKPNFNYRRMSPVPHFHATFPPSNIGESTRRRSYSRDKSVSPNRAHKRRRPHSPSPKRSSRRNKRSRSGRHSHRRRRSGSSGSRSRSRSRSRRNRKKSSRKRSRSRSGDRTGLNDLRKRWTTSHSSKKTSHKPLKERQNGHSSSWSSSSSESEEERNKSVQRKVAKLIERCHMENRLQGAFDLQMLSQQGLVTGPQIQIGPTQLQMPQAQIQMAATQIQVTPMPVQVPLQVPPSSVQLQLYQPSSVTGPISQFVPAASEVETEKEEKVAAALSGPSLNVIEVKPEMKLVEQISVVPIDRAPNPSACRTPEGRTSPFVLKEVIDHTVSERESVPTKKTKRRPRTPPPPPEEPYCGEEFEQTSGSKSNISPQDENVVVTPSDGPFGMLLIGLTRCCVKSEEDAQIALFVASSLTRSLADYQLAAQGRHNKANNNSTASEEGTLKKEDSAFNELMARSLPHLQDFQETYRKTKGSEATPGLTEKKTQAIIEIHDEISTLFNADEATDSAQNHVDKSDNNNLNTLGSDSPASSECLLELPDEVEVKAKIPQKLELTKPQIDPSAIRSRASAVWEPMFAGNNP